MLSFVVRRITKAIIVRRTQPRAVKLAAGWQPAKSRACQSHEPRREELGPKAPVGRSRLWVNQLRKRRGSDARVGTGGRNQANQIDASRCH